MSLVGKFVLCVLFFTSINATLLPVTKQLSTTKTGSFSNQSQPMEKKDNTPGFVTGNSEFYFYHHDDSNYFEGDLNITQNDIDVYYNKGRFKRAIRRDKEKLWPEGIVYYMFHNSIDPTTKNTIAKAIHEIEQHTCLHFELIKSYHMQDHLEFTGEGNKCLSSIGRIGGKQFIHLPHAATFGTVTCRNHGIVLHELLHALGIWHEQSRPDRDKYVQVLKDNVQTGRERNFKTRSGREVDSHGVAYDYGSIMHYELNAFSTNGEPTLRIINMEEYTHQGQPTIGQRQHLSRSDIVQANRMYNCPGSGVPGHLRIYIKNGHGIPQIPKHDTYIKIKATDDNRLHKFLSVQGGENSSSWYQWIDFGKRCSWQHLEMSIWTNDSASEKQLTDQQTFSVTLGNHKRLRYCDNQNCSIRVYFAYSLLNNDISHLCNQTAMLYPSEQKNGTLQIYIHLYDEWLFDVTCISVIAYNHNGDRKHFKTRLSVRKSERGIEEWNHLFDFGINTWTQFNIEVYYEHSGGLKRCTNTSIHHLHSYNSQKSVKQGCDIGYFFFDYYFLPPEHSTAKDCLSYQYFTQAWTLVLVLFINNA